MITSARLKLMSGVATALLISGAAWAQTSSGQGGTAETPPTVQQQTQTGTDAQVETKQGKRSTTEAETGTDAGTMAQQPPAGSTTAPEGEPDATTEESVTQDTETEATEETQTGQTGKEQRKDRKQAREKAADEQEATTGQRKDRKQARERAGEEEEETTAGERTDDQQARDRTEEEETTTDRRKDRADRKEARKKRDKEDIDIEASISIDLAPRQRTVIYEHFLAADIEPVSAEVDVIVGETVPSVVALHPVPTEVVEVVPEFRNHMHFVLRDERVAIVDPCTMRIVAIIS